MKNVAYGANKQWGRGFCFPETSCKSQYKLNNFIPFPLSIDCIVLEQLQVHSKIERKIIVISRVSPSPHA